MRIPEGVVVKLKLLDAREERVECGAVITAEPVACKCYWRAYGCHECPSCGGDQALVHGLLCESCAQCENIKNNS